MKATYQIALLVFGGILSCGECGNATSTPPPVTPTKVPTTKLPTKAPVITTSSPTTSPTVLSTVSPTGGPTKSISTSSPTILPTLSSTKIKTPSNSTTKTSAPVASNNSSKVNKSPSLSPTVVGTNPTPAPSAGTAFPTIVSGVSYFATPKVKWSVQLSQANPGSAQLVQGNAVTVSQDGGLIYVTLSNGSLEIRKASNGDFVKAISPPANAMNALVTCKSGVAFGSLQGIGAYAVYAVVDVPPTGSSEDPTSRIVAVTHPAGELLWISQSLPGAIQGTPAVANGPSVSDNYIMVTHNLNTTSTTTDPDGVFSVFQANSNITLLFSEINSKAYPKDPYGPYPYGPLTMANGPGNYPGGELNTNNVFVWTTSRKAGKSNKGFTFAFQLPVVFQTSLVHLLNTTRLNKVRWNAAARPTLTQNGQSLFVGVSEAQLRGWTKNVNFEQTAKWQQQLAQASDKTTPVPTAPILSTSEARLYASSPTPNLYGIQAANGHILWTANLTSTLSSEVKVAPDDVYVYAIQPTGEVQAFDQITGKLAWTVTCASLGNFTNTTCRDGVTAEFSLSPKHGLVLYYSDYLGNVKALQLGTLLAPTVAPTDYPSFTSNVNTPAPSSPATSAPTTKAPSPLKSKAPSQSPTTAPSKQMQSANTPAPSSSSTTAAPSVVQSSSAPSVSKSSSPSSSPSFGPFARPTRKPLVNPLSASSGACSRSSMSTVFVTMIMVMAVPAWMGFV